MGKLKENWRKQLWYEKVIHMIGLLASVGAIVLPLLYLLGIWDNTAKIYIPLLALLMLIQAFDNRKSSRTLMIFSLCAGAFMGICWLLIIVLS